MSAEYKCAAGLFVSLERYLKIWNTEEICGQFGSFDGSAYHIALLGACSDNVVSASLFVGFR